MTAFIILTTGIMTGACLRLTYLRLPLDWDHGLLLYQSYWFTKIHKFIVTIYEIEPEASLSKIIRPFGDTDMARTQSLAHSFIFIILYRLCKDRVWAYRLFDLFYYTLITLMLFGLGTVMFDPVSAAIGAALFSVFSCMPFFWVAMDNTEKFQILFTYSGVLCLALFSMNIPTMFLPAVAGICFFISMLFKQNVGFVVLAGLVFLLVQGKFFAVMLTIGVIFVCYGFILIHYVQKGRSLSAIFSRFFMSIPLLIYLFDLRVDKEGKVTTPQKFNLVARIKPNFVKILDESSFIWFMSSAWFVFIALTDIRSPGLHLFGLLAVGTALAFFAANKLFPYYYIPFLPVLSLTSGDFLHRMYVGHGLFSAQGMLLTAASAFLAGWDFRSTWRFFLKSTPFEQGAYMYGNTLFNFGVSEEIGRHIRENTSPDDYIYVYNLNPEIYFFAQRRCPTNSLYIDHLSSAAYTAEENQRAELAIRDRLRESSPAYIVMNKALNVPIAFFEGVTGEKYFLEKEYHAGFDAVKNPVTLQMFRKRKIREAGVMVAEGEGLFEQGKIDEAMISFRRALDLDPLNGDALNNLGVCHFRQGDLERSVEYFIRALEADPYNRDVVLNLLDMELDVKEKFKVLQVYLAFNPHDAEMKQLSESMAGARQ